MKLRSRFAPPPLDRSSALPLALAVLLCAALALQALVGDTVEFPAAGPVRGGGPASLAADRPLPAVADPAIAARSMFTPILSVPKEGAAAAPTSLGGYAVVGVIQVGRATYAVGQGPGQQAFRAGPGQRIGEWQVRRVTHDEVQLSRGSERMRIRFGSSGPVTTAIGKGER